MEGLHLIMGRQLRVGCHTKICMEFKRFIMVNPTRYNSRVQQRHAPHEPLMWQCVALGTNGQLKLRTLLFGLQTSCPKPLFGLDA